MAPAASRPHAHVRRCTNAALAISEAPSANSTVSTHRGSVAPGIANSGFAAGLGGPLRMPTRNAGTSSSVATAMSTTPRRRMCREMRHRVHPCAVRDWAIRLRPAPIRKKNPGAQKCVTKRVRNGSALV